jgi:DNA-binding LacI/PurR family transcriptional regulator
MPATLIDVARRARVSKSTVSNVVRGNAVVAPATRARVEAVITELGYRPDGVARALRRGSTGLVGLIVPDGVNPFYAQLAVATERELRRFGLGLVMVSTDSDSEVERAQLDALLERRADGVIIGGLTRGSIVEARLSQEGVPAVLAAAEGTGQPGIGVVDACDREGMDAIAEHLFTLGHRRVAFVGHLVNEVGAERRRELLAAAVARHGIAMVDDRTTATAIVAHDDVTAVGLIDELERCGRRVPSDVSVVGYDGIPLGAHTRLRLTTVETDLPAVARAAATMLIDALRDGTMAAEHVRVPPRLIVRASTAPPAD